MKNSNRIGPRITASFVLLLFGILPMAGARVVDSSSRMIIAEARQKHPRGALLAVALTESARELPVVCATYVNNFQRQKKANRGSISVAIEILRNGTVLERKSLAGGVENGRFFQCLTLESSLTSTDTVVGALSFRGFPRLRRGRGMGVFLDLR